MEKLGEAQPLVMAAVGLMAFALDYIGTAEIQAITKNEPLKAGALSALGILVGGVLLYAFIDNPINMIPEAIAGGAGTALMVWQHRRHERIQAKRLETFNRKVQ